MKSAANMPLVTPHKTSYEVKESVSNPRGIPTIITKTPSTEKPSKGDFNSLEAIDKVQLVADDQLGLPNARSLSVSDFSYRLEQEGKLRDLVYSASDHNIYELSDKTAQFGVPEDFVKRKTSVNDSVGMGVKMN